MEKEKFITIYNMLQQKYICSYFQKEKMKDIPKTNKNYKLKGREKKQGRRNGIKVRLLEMHLGF